MGRPVVSEDGDDSRPALSAVVLGYRAEEALPSIVAPLHDELIASGIDFELVLVANYNADDPDGTARIAAEFANERDHVVVLAEPKAGGMGWDMRSGLMAARGDFIVVIDGDGQNPTSDVMRIYEAHLKSGSPVIKGRRSIRGDGWVRQVISAVYNVAFILMFRARGLWDVNGKPKGIARTALGRMNLKSDDWFADAEIVLEARRLGLGLEEIPVRFDENRHRGSFVNWRTVVEFVRNMLARRLGR